MWDPVYLELDAPNLLWLRVMSVIEVFVFGPSYGALALLIQRGSPRLYPVALTLSGALLYSTLLYFAVEIMTQKETQANITMVTVVNAPWVIVPMFLIRKLCQTTRTKAT